MALALQTLLHDRYRIEQLLAQGGMGAVYRSMDLHLQVQCAIKENLASQQHTEMAEQFARQFEIEASILAQLRHPNLPRVTDHFILNGNQYLVMDYIEGEDLAHLIEHQGAFSEQEALGYVKQVCDALTFLHTRPKIRIIHRDIKPHNIKITPEGQVMVVDFGLSKFYEPTQGTALGAKGWTPGFSPPEQYELGHTDHRSDEYALAATLYALLTAQAPPDALERQLGYAVLRPPRDLNSAISERTSSAILRALSIDPQARFQSVAEFRAALSSEPRAAPKPPSQSTTQIPRRAEPEGSLVSKANRAYVLQRTRPNTIGRYNRQTGETPEVDLSDEPSGDTVSRKHARIVLQGEQWLLEPYAGHKNVIRVNGQNLGASGAPLRAGDQIQIGGVTLRFQMKEK